MTWYEVFKHIVKNKLYEKLQLLEEFLQKYNGILLTYSLTPTPISSSTSDNYFYLSYIYSNIVYTIGYDDDYVVLYYFSFNNVLDTVLKFPINNFPGYLIQLNNIFIGVLPF